MYSETGLMDPKGAKVVLDVFKVGPPDVAKADIDVEQTYTNEFAEGREVGSHEAVRAQTPARGYSITAL